MPAMANITVKNAANADVVWTGTVPSSGDKTPARWISQSASAIIGFRPVFDVVTRDNSNKNGRLFDATFAFPITQTVSGVTSKVATVPFRVSGTLPTNVDATIVADAFVQLGNLMVSTLVRAVASDGYAPT